MNNKIFMAGAVVCGLALASCSEDFLDTSSKTESNTETFYKSETDAYRALIGCYDGWRQTSSNPGISFYLASGRLPLRARDSSRPRALCVFLVYIETLPCQHDNGKMSLIVITMALSVKLIKNSRFGY